MPIIDEPDFQDDEECLTLTIDGTRMLVLEWPPSVSTMYNSEHHVFDSSYMDSMDVWFIERGGLSCQLMESFQG
jgi:hypothetical protein